LKIDVVRCSFVVDNIAIDVDDDDGGGADSESIAFAHVSDFVSTRNNFSKDILMFDCVCVCVCVCTVRICKQQFVRIDCSELMVFLVVCVTVIMRTLTSAQRFVTLSQFVVCGALTWSNYSHKQEEQYQKAIELSLREAEQAATTKKVIDDMQESLAYVKTLPATKTERDAADANNDDDNNNNDHHKKSSKSTSSSTTTTAATAITAKVANGDRKKQAPPPPRRMAKKSKRSDADDDDDVAVGLSGNDDDDDGHSDDDDDETHASDDDSDIAYDCLRFFYFVVHIFSRRSSISGNFVFAIIIYY
jgi:hypothetical protein